MNKAQKVEFESICEDVWKTAEDLLGIAWRLESMGCTRDGDGLREIVGQIETWIRFSKGE